MSASAASPQPRGTGTHRPGALPDLLRGLRLFGRGASMVLGSRRLLLLGATPALVTTVLYVAGLVLLVIHLDGFAAAVTPFADGWAGAGRTATRVAAGIALLVAAGAVAVVTFVAVTLALGGPFYDRLAELVDERAGPAPPGPGRPWLASVLRGLRDAVALVLVSVLVAAPLLVAGFLPVVGQTVVPVLSALVGGWLLMLELSGAAGERRGLRLADRHRTLRTRRALAWGVGVPTYLLCAIPFVAVLAMPAGAAAATLLLRETAGTASDASGPPARPPGDR